VPPITLFNFQSMNKIQNHTKLLKNSPMRNLLFIGKWLFMIWLLAINPSMAQTVRLEQGQNGGINNDPVSPVNWATGNSNSSNSHFFEGQSIPYRLTISRLRAGNHIVEIEWDTRTNNKSAIDYITSFDRICEEVIPGPGNPSFGTIPTPSGIPQPSTSFNQLSADERQIAIYGGTIGKIEYVQQGNVSATNAVTRLRIPFTVSGSNGPSNTVVIAWGGHIASARDWGKNNSASSINGSPYHTRVISLNGSSVGGQDRSVQAASEVIDFDPKFEINGKEEVCTGSTETYLVPAGASGYSWSVTGGGEITSGQGTNSISVKWTSSGNVAVDVDNPGACEPKSRNLDVTVNTPPTLTFFDAVLCSSENGGNTQVGDLTEFVSSSSVELIFTRNGQTIENPESVLLTHGDVIEVTPVGGCGITESFTVTVNDRQTFDICSQSKVYEPTGSELKALSETFKRGQNVKSNEIFYISGDEVLIEVIYFKDKFNQAKNILEGLGFVTPTEEVLKQDPNSLIIAGFIPIGNLLKINEHSDVINYVRPAIPGVPNRGATTTQGDRVMRSNLVRAGYSHFEGDQPIDGNGIKIGVLSDSYATRRDAGVNDLSLDISNGDLPANLYFNRDLPSRFGIGSDEGRAMLQIIHDIAPGAELGFRTGVITAGDFAQGIRDLANAGSDIIVDDITYVTEPFFSDGRVARAVNEVVGNGVSYFTSAGNFGSKSFEGVFTPFDDPKISLPLNSGKWEERGRVHQFANGQTSQSIKVFPGQSGPAVYMIALQWDDPLYSIDETGSLYDLDIYLKDFGTPLFGFNRNNTNGDPIEILSFTVTEETYVNLVIARECESCTDLDSNREIKFKYVVFRGELDPNDPNGINASTIVGHANAEGAMSVGAVLYANTSVFGFDKDLVPEGTAQFTVASFSSRGGTFTNGELRNKPDFTAPNGVNTTVNLGAPDLEGDGFPNFFGTSAAAPHAAAIAALIKQARKKYYPNTKPEGWIGEPGISLPEDIRNLLKNTAQDMHEPGDDIKSGSGLVRADKALLSLAAPNPDNIALVYDDDINPGEVEFKLIITGTNLYEGSNVYLRDEQLKTIYGVDIQGFGFLEVTVPVFEGNPEITVVNNAISDSGLDGGTAGPVTFFDVVKKTIAIRADNITKKYGQILEPFTASVRELNGNNEWVESELTLEDVGLTLDPDDENKALVLLTLSSEISGDLAEVGTYIITATHPKPGVAFSDFFNYVGRVVDGNLFYDGTSDVFGNYGPGIVAVQTLPITIKPVDLVLEYGKSISNALEFEVIINEEDAAKITASNLQIVKTAVLDQYLLDLELAKQPGDNSLPLGIFNGRDIINKNMFVNRSFMVSRASMTNGRTIIDTRSVVNGRPIVNSAFDVPIGTFLDFLIDPDNQTTNPVTINGKAMINARTIIDTRSVVNGRSIINGKSIVNAKTIVNGKTIVNAKSILNSIESGEEEQESSDLVVFGELDLEGATETETSFDFGEVDDDEFNLEFFSINMVTGTDVGEHFSIPGTFASRNFRVSYLPGELEITPASLTVITSADPNEIAFGSPAPTYSSEFEGFAYSSTFLDSEGKEVTVQDDKASVVDKIEYTLFKGGKDFPSTGIIDLGEYSIRPEVTLYTPANYTLDLKNSTFGTLSVTGCVNIAPIVREFETAMGAGNTSNPATIKKPDNTQIGDILVVGLMFEKGRSPSITPPDNDWELIERVNASNQVAMATFYKVIKSNDEPDTYGFRINQSPKWTMGIIRVSGADINHPDGPIAAFSGASGGRAFVATAPSLTTEDCNSLVMLFYTNKTNATWTQPSGTVKVYDDPNNKEGLTSNMMAYFVQGDAGNTGPQGAIASKSESWVAQAIAVRPLRISNASSARILTEDMVESSVMTISDTPSTLDADGALGQIKAYPNPVSDRLNISLKGFVEEEPSDNSLVILDAMGRPHFVPRAWFGDESRRPSWKIPSELRSRAKTKSYFLFLFYFRMILKSILVRKSTIFSFVHRE
jgi:carbonic anhydrase/acetyltransferase-like protein (isoleucine patch superfamily)